MKHLHFRAGWAVIALILGATALLGACVSTTTTTGKDIELVLNTWPAQPVTKTQILQALKQFEDCVIQSNNLP